MPVEVPSDDKFLNIIGQHSSTKKVKGLELVEEIVFSYSLKLAWGSGAQLNLISLKESFYFRRVVSRGVVKLGCSYLLGNVPPFYRLSPPLPVEDLLTAFKCIVVTCPLIFLRPFLVLRLAIFIASLRFSATSGSPGDQGRRF
jgi:hypothetical protein